MLIDCSYFTKGQRRIKNATIGIPKNPTTLPNPDYAVVDELINGYISDYQEEFLIAMLGSKTANKVNAYLVCQQEDETPPHVESLEKVCEKLKEPFADYVFFHILRDTQTQSTITGVVRLKTVDEYVAPIRKQVDTWNRMVDRNRIFADWVNTEDCQMAGISVDNHMLTKINTLNL